MQASIVALVTYKKEKRSNQNEDVRVVTGIFHYRSMGIFPDTQGHVNAAVLGPIWLNFELVRDIMDVLVTCKNQEDQIKNKGPRVFTSISTV